MKSLWNLLLLLLCPKIDDEEGNSEQEEQTEKTEEHEETEESEDTDGTEETEELDDNLPKKESRAEKEIRTLRERAQRAEDENRKALAELADARRPQQAQQPTNDQILWQQEEAILKDPSAEEWQKYAVRGNREARLARQEAQQVRSQSMDMADRSEFATLAMDKPKTYAAYKDRVEARLKEFRVNGGNPTRKQVLTVLMGEDMLEGNLKTADTKTTKSKSSGERGKTPGVSSNVSSKGGKLTEAEKRVRRLENVRI